jgi:hypothetical protein
MHLMKNRCTIFLIAIALSAPSLPAFSYDLIIPDTGQNLCYDWERIMCDEWHMEGFYQVCDSAPYCPSEGEDFYGQDAQYTINPPDLTDNGNGTVTDNLTGLVWEQKTEESERSTFAYSEAVSYCETLSLGDNDDWRVPTRREFSTILNHGRLSPSLDVTYFPDYTYASANEVYYWTSSVYHDDPSQVWKLQMSFGIAEAIITLSPPHKVRCVRGATEPAASYTDNGNGTVTDNVTGLIWEQKTDDGSSRDKDTTFTWKDALAYCENLILGGFANWRLPNPKELERIVDLSTSNPAADTTYFPNTNNGFYWTGTTCVGCHKFKALAYDFSDGKLYFGVKFKNDVYGENYVRCVTHPNPDDDGVIYPEDNCPYDANPGQEDSGDGDGVGDVCDNCPGDSNPNQTDTDTDGWGNLCDNCPSVSNPNQEDTLPPLGNGIGDACDCECDFDCSGGVDALDVTAFLGDFGRSTFNNPCTNSSPCNGDVDCNVNVDAIDVNKFLEDFGRSQFNNPCPACVAEDWCAY